MSTSRAATLAERAGEATRTGDRAPPPESTSQDPVDPEPVGSTQVHDPGRYEMVGEHGRGGLGRVSRARDRALGRDVAIKELISRSQLGELRFMREALITARLEHPGIVPVHEAGQWPDGTPFYAMKLVAGRPLRDLINERNTREQRFELLHHVIAVADAIAYAHGRNIIHRDLKPANIIVGDFGETIVIDWGLAKDLTTSDDPPPSSSSPRSSSRESDLTTTGSVLGTPAYMAPEQERGEHVDQRADVYAIGAMLWELCAFRKLVPPGDRHQRQRMLRRAGIDPDLATIIDKTLDPDPAGRYSDAGALAADLKAFKSGARIAARRYTLFGLFVHWLRRHRALAIAAAALLVISIIATTAYIRNIAQERDRSRASNNNLLLEHAELLLHSDPTAAVATLADYRGDDVVRSRRLLAEAYGRGVAKAVMTPHIDTIWFLEGDRNGGIVSVGEDRRIQLTQDGVTTTLASDVATHMLIAHAPAARLLAYATTPPGIALFDLNTRRSTRISSISPYDMDFSPDGSRLAAIDERGRLTVWSVQTPASVVYEDAIPGPRGLRFATPTRLIAQDAADLIGIPLDGHSTRDRSLSPGVVSFDARPDAVATGSETGAVALLSDKLAPRERITVCNSAVTFVDFIAHSDQIAFACREGRAGVVSFDASTNQLAIVYQLSTRGPTTIIPDPSGRHVAIIEESRTAYLYDTRTRLTTRYEGSAGYPSYIAAPTSDYNATLIGDSNGTARVWDPPPQSIQVLLQANESLLHLAFFPDGETLLAGGLEGLIHRIKLGDRSAVELPGHTGGVTMTRVAPDGSSFLSVSWDHTVRVRRGSDSELLRQFSDHMSAVAAADYVDAGRRIVSAGDDGRVLAWSPTGTDVLELFHHTKPLTSLQVLRRNNHVVVSDVAGAVWDISLDGASRLVRSSDGTTNTVLSASPDGRLLAIGTESGRAIVYDTREWQIVKEIATAGSIRRIVFDPLDRDVLIASEAGRSQFGHVVLAALDDRRTVRWRTITVAARDVAYASDGETMAVVCGDGGIWLYATRTDTWAYALDHDTDVFEGAFSPDGERFASVDKRGRVVIRDVRSTLTEAQRRDTSRKTYETGANRQETRSGH